MPLSALISDPDAEWVAKLKSHLVLNELVVHVAENGKESQLSISKNKFDVSIMDMDLKDHSCLEVLRFIKLRAPSVRILLTIKSRQLLKQLDITEDDLKRLGADEVMIKPVMPEKLLQLIQKEYKLESWKDIKETTDKKEAVEVSASDEEFTSVKIGDYFSGKTTIFDHYVRLGKNHYIKILHKGECFDPSRLKKYEESKLEHLYFKTSDRLTYINYSNEILQRIVGKNVAPIEKKVGYTKTVVEKYIQEVYTTGFKPGLVDEGKKICENIYNIVQKEQDLHKILKSYEDYDPPAFAHLFLVSFFSVITCKNLDWAGSRTTEVVALASLFHDIGFLKLPPGLREKPVNTMSKKEIELYHSHPQLGAEMLSKFPSIPVAATQIVYQHHEYVNAEGFPNNLNGTKIYPLAKIVGLCDAFAEFLIENKLSPLEGLKQFASYRSNITKFDPAIFKALVLGFVKEK